jgi:hypothetical protein
MALEFPSLIYSLSCAMRIRLWGIFLLSLLAIQCLAKTAIHIDADPAILQNPVSRNALTDFTALLDSACHCLQSNPESAEVILTIQAPSQARHLLPSDFGNGRNYPYFHYAEHGFTWSKSEGPFTYTGTRTEIQTLDAPSAEGIANGLYALLQEKLGFKFIHPRQTIIPKLESWPSIQDPHSTFDGRPKFDKKGFHLHTMHPLELTEPLHDPAFPGGLAMVQEYILWLARNGQNYFEFSLMEGVDQDLTAWVRHASKFTQYAHDRGILCGIDLSIHMIQQKSFQLVQFPPHDFRAFESQVHTRLSTLMEAHWDFINLEFALAEFVGGLEGLRNRLRDIVLSEMENYPKTKLIGRQHVVKPEDEVGGSHGTQSLNIPEDPRMGILVHTVMCYALQDTHVPVYELDNFDHLYQMLIDQNKIRETWYYPESAYWITFDNSIPLLLLPYLDARYRDIQACAELGIPGHVTFSSGWEWGYWLVDWSIARWSWDYGKTELDGVFKSDSSGPYQYLGEIFTDPADLHTVVKAAEIEKDWLIRNNLLRWLCPSSRADELPKPMNKQFQPRGFVNLGDLRKVAENDAARLTELPIDSLHRFCTLLMVKATALQIAATNHAWESRLQLQLALEIIDALKVTALRAQHSARLMEAVVAYDAAGLSKEALEIGLANAAKTRMKALELVQKQEKRYRYPVSQIGAPYKSHTSYDFGYLYTVHDLHLWDREEQQILKGRHGPFFMNIYDLAKIAGLKN